MLLVPSQASQLPSLSGAFAALAAADRHSQQVPRRQLRETAPAISEDVDWPLVVSLRRTAAERIGEVADTWLTTHGVPMPDEDRRVRGRAIIREVVHAHAEQLTTQGQGLWPISLEMRYAEAVASAIFGFGRLQPLLDLPDVENIEITGWDCVMAQYPDGRRVPQPKVADSDEELIEAIRFLGETANPPRPFDDAHPTITLALGHRFRLHAIGFGLSHRPSVIIRQHTLTSVTLKQLSDSGMLPLPVARFLAQAVLARKSIVISGDQGAGKTTLLRALIAEIPHNERFGTLETDYELLTHLQPERRNMLALQAKVGLGEMQGGRRIGEWSVADLIPEALRQNLTRLVVGEVRGAEAGAMFEAMQAGAGTLSTTHSHSASSTIDRLAARVAQGGVLTVDEALRQIAHNIAFIIHVTLIDDTWRGGTRRRCVSEVRQLTGGMENGRPTTHLVYQAGPPPVFQPEAGMIRELAPFQGVSWER